MQRVTFFRVLRCRLTGLNSRENFCAWMMDDTLFGVSAFCTCKVNFLSVCAQPIQKSAEVNWNPRKTETRKIMFARDISENSSSFLHIYFSYDYSYYKHCKNCRLDLQVVFVIWFFWDIEKLFLWNWVTQPFTKLILFDWCFNPFNHIPFKLFRYILYFLILMLSLFLMTRVGLRMKFLEVWILFAYILFCRPEGSEIAGRLEAPKMLQLLSEMSVLASFVSTTISSVSLNSCQELYHFCP